VTVAGGPEDCLPTAAVTSFDRCADAGLPLVDNRLTPELLMRAARRADIAARELQRPAREVTCLVLPAILLLDQGRIRVVVLERLDSDGTARLILSESAEAGRSAARGQPVV
jgi:ATP-binding cassette subfamily C protein LapB